MCLLDNSEPPDDGGMNTRIEAGWEKTGVRKEETKKQEKETRVMKK
jgi:hypothetical protein